MLLDHHRAKIVTSDALLAAIGPRPRPRGRTVIMCHGVFDIVHPGHLRHLLYAKSKADVLVCGVTSDLYVPKGPYRPHVPQDLRTASLAMLDIVDYVIVCDQEKPDDLIALLQPDFFAKGFEYAERPEGPIGEVAIVESYGGEVLFTPGDVRYSSSALIESAAPDLRWEKLDTLMVRAGLSFADLRQRLLAMRGQHVHVVGDSIVDSLLHCEMIGAGAKTPTISVRRDHRDDFVGGAAIVAKHARAAGASVEFSTVLGDDKFGLMVLDDLRAGGVDAQPIIDRARPTTLKEAVVVDGYRLLKIDTVDNRSISDVVLRRLCEQIRETRGGAVVMSDFRHGIFNARTIPLLTSAIPERCQRVADSQVASRWGNIADFCGFDLITPNEREARFAIGDQDSGVRTLASHLCEAAQCRGLLMKLGPRGVLGFGPSDVEGGQSFVLGGFATRVVDPVGAGDAFLAYATLALLTYPRLATEDALDASPRLATAAILGSFAAAIECEYDGNVPIAPEWVLAKIDEAAEEIGR